MDGLESIHEAIPSDLLPQMLEEFRTGWALRKVQAKANAKLLGKLNQEEHNHVEGLGEMTMRIPVESYHYWGKRLGYDCWRDAGFRKEFLRDNPECRVNSKAAKTTVRVEGRKPLYDAYGVPIS
jgi:hypothetical protein